jgi:hypothetical protein
MTTDETFTFRNKWSEYPNCKFVTNRYQNNNLALQIVDDEDVIATCTVCTGKVTDETTIAIKDYSENEGMVDFLQSLDIIEKTPTYIERSGWVTIPYYKLTLNGQELFM